MPAKLDRCVADVKAGAKKRGKKVNPWAVCRSTLGTDAEIVKSDPRRPLTSPGGLTQRGGYLARKHGQGV